MVKQLCEQYMPTPTQECNRKYSRHCFCLALIRYEVESQNANSVQIPKKSFMPSGRVGALWLDGSSSHCLPDEWEAPRGRPTQEDWGSEGVESGKVLPPECGSEAQEPIRIGLQVLGMSERGEHGVRQREGLSVTTKMEGKGEKKWGKGKQRKKN